jgi:hypothetical protein
MAKERICIRTQTGWVCEPPVGAANDAVEAPPESPPETPKDKLKKAIKELVDQQSSEDEVEKRHEDIVKVVKLLLSAYEADRPLIILSRESDGTGDGLF